MPPLDKCLKFESILEDKNAYKITIQINIRNAINFGHLSGCGSIAKLVLQNLKNLVCKLILKISLPEKTFSGFERLVCQILRQFTNILKLGNLIEKTKGYFYAGVVFLTYLPHS